MTKAEFQAFAVSGAFESVVIRREGSHPMVGGEFVLWCHVPGFCKSERFFTARGDVKGWTDLSTVYREVRAMGYAGPIVVEG